MTDNNRLKSTEYGPTGSPRCPHCGNSLQNAWVHDEPNLQRCATCKHVFEVPVFGIKVKGGAAEYLIYRVRKSQRHLYPFVPNKEQEPAVRKGLYCFSIGDDLYWTPMEEVEANSQIVTEFQSPVERVFVNPDTGKVE